jgi:hypothetical protein
MCCGATGPGLVIRLGESEMPRVLSRPYVRPLNLTGRPLRGFVFVSPRRFSGDRSVSPSARALRARPDAECPLPAEPALRMCARRGRSYAPRQPQTHGTQRFEDLRVPLCEVSCPPPSPSVAACGADGPETCFGTLGGLGYRPVLSRGRRCSTNHTSHLPTDGKPGRAGCKAQAICRPG